MKMLLLSSVLVTSLATRLPASAGDPPRVGAPAGDEAHAATLDVASDPVAKILIDAVDTGKTTPERHLFVKPGRHKLTLVTLDGRRQRTLGFTIEAGETRKFTVHLAQ
ncbi:MAG TPA: hypothetical protein VK841_24575 [Polyangiaceae bacterium]|jgi:hypothetical protein|nr:hypothetical protein [Polyangiaceae bacterium]